MVHQEKGRHLGDDIATGNPRAGRIYGVGKSCMDIFGALFLLALLSPLMGVIALLIKLDSPGPVLFRQERLGRGGKRFIIYKLRTMHDRADTTVHERYVRSLIKGEGSGCAIAKMVDDHRVTRLGRALRKSSLDELPQLVNVLKGDLSLVGPRPAIPYEVEEYKDWHFSRLQVKPGITGLWQATARGRASFDQMVQLDLTYINKRSLFFDIWILLKTIPAVIHGRGAG